MTFMARKKRYGSLPARKPNKHRINIKIPGQSYLASDYDIQYRLLLSMFSKKEQVQFQEASRRLAKRMLRYLNLENKYDGQGRLIDD